MFWMACIQWDRGSDGNKIPSLKIPNKWNLVSMAPRKGECNQWRTCQLGKDKSTTTDSKLLSHTQTDQQNVT